MTNSTKPDLLELADSVEAGDVSSDIVLIDKIADALGVCGEGYVSGAIEWGSLDAAKALHDAVLPEWDATLKIFDSYGYEAIVSLMAHSKCGKDIICKSLSNSNPAVAWVGAILRAKAAE